MSDQQDVLVITQFFPPESMGGAHRWEKLAANLDDSINPHILTSHPTFPFGEFERRWRLLSRETTDGIPITRLFTYQPTEDSAIGRILNYGVFSMLCSLYVLLTFWRYDSVVTMSAPHTTFLPGVVAKILGRAWIVDIFDLWIDNAADLGYVDENSVAYHLVSFLEHLSFANADVVFVITDTMAKYYENKYPDLCFDVQVVPFGVDTELFSPEVNPKTSTDIIYTGNLGAGQAFVPFIKGFAKLEHDLELTIVGEGERRDEIEDLIEQLGISSWVSFEGYVSRSHIPSLLAGANVSLVPLKTDYQLDYARPTKLLETMAVGTPYIASNVQEIDYLTRKYNTGCSVENNADKVHKHLKNMCLDSQKRENMGSNGIEFVKNNHDWVVIGGEISDIFHKLSRDSI